MPVIEVHAADDASPREFRLLGNCLRELIARGYLRPVDADQEEALLAWASGDGDPLPVFCAALHPRPHVWLRRHVPGDLVEDLTIDGVSWNDPHLMRLT